VEGSHRAELLTHTSGIADYTDSEYAKAGGLINLRGDYTEAELYQKLIQLPLNSRRGRNGNTVIRGMCCWDF